MAGTNGKGSTIAYMKAILEAGGYAVHAFTSPAILRPGEQIACARAWSAWEGGTITLLPDPEAAASFAEDRFALAFARIENHYFAHGGWMDEGQLLRDADRLRAIPGTIVQGRYDAATPVRSAWDLHRAWPEADFHLIPDAGHAYSEPATLDRLLRTNDSYADLLG